MIKRTHVHYNWDLFNIIGTSGNQDPAYFRLPEPLILFTNKSVPANEESVIQ